MFYILSLLLVGTLVKFGYSDPYSKTQATRFIEAPSSSGNVSGLNPRDGKQYSVVAIWASTPTTNGQLSDYFLVLNTNPANAIPSHESFASENYKAPPTYFPISTTTANNTLAPISKVIDYGSEGVAFSTPPYVFKSGSTSGMARRVYFQIKE